MAMERQTAAFEIALEQPTVEQIMEVLSHLEYVYNVYALFQAAREGYRFPKDQLIRTLRAQEFLGIHQTNQLVRNMLHPEAYLRTGTIPPHSPLQITFDGLAKVIESLVSLFDPIRWMAHWEDLRQKKGVSWKAERPEQLETIRREVATVRGLRDLEQELRSTYRHGASPEELDYLTRAACDAAAHLVRSLIEKGVRVEALKPTE